MEYHWLKKESFKFFVSKEHYVPYLYRILRYFLVLRKIGIELGVKECYIILKKPLTR